MVLLPRDIVSFWIDAGPHRWFAADPDFDALTRARFLDAHEDAARGDLPGWDASPEGALALILLTDQFPRNMFRATPRAFATDALAVRAAEKAIARAFDRAYQPPLRRFFYLPFMHSERLADQERSVALYRALDGDGLRYAEIHRDAIARFGRFPHRNPVLGRAMTAEERKYLDEGGFAG